jgi:hypothetical protein
MGRYMKLILIKKVIHISCVLFIYMIYIDIPNKLLKRFGRLKKLSYIVFNKETKTQKVRISSNPQNKWKHK